MIHRNVKIRLLSSFFHVALGTMFLPFMVIYFAENFGAAITGMILVINVICGILASFYGGDLSDRIGRRPIILWSGIISVLVYGVMAAANSSWLHSPILTFICTTINSINFGFAAPAEDAMIIDVTDSSNRKLVYGISYWSFNLAAFLGSVLGGFFFEHYFFQLLTSMCVLSVLSFLLDYLFILESHVPSPIRQPLVIAKYLSVIRDRAFMIFVIATALLFSLEHQVRNYISVRLTQTMPEQALCGWEIGGVQVCGLLWAENTILVVLLGLVVANVIKRHKEAAMLLIGASLYITSFAFISVSETLMLLYTFMAFATIGELICVPITQSVLADIPPEHNRSAYMAVRSVCQRLSGIMGSLSVTVGAFLSSWAMGLLFFMIGFLSIGLFVWFFRSQVRSPSGQEA